MIPEGQLIALIDRIYEAALDPDLWPSVLEKIADATGTVQAGIASADRQANIVTAIARRIDPDLLDHWKDSWALRDPFFTRAILRPPEEIYTLDDLIAREEFAATAAFKEVWQPAGCSLATAASNLVVEGKFCILLGISNTPGQEYLSAEQLRLFKVIARHAGRSVRMSREIWKLDLASLAVEAQFEILPDTAMLVDAFGRVVLANAAARRMLEAGDGLIVHNGRLAAISDLDTLQRLVVSCAQARTGPDGLGGELIVPRTYQCPAVRVTVAPLRSRVRLADVPWIGCGRPVAIVTVRDPDLNRQRREESLRRRFGLTCAEAALAAEILKGDGRRAAAQRCGITDGTAKTHLAHIFAKTGTCRQAALIRLLMSTAETPRGKR